MWMLFALLLSCMHLLSPPSEQSESVEIVFLSDCASVRLCARSEPVNPNSWGTRF